MLVAFSRAGGTHFKENKTKEDAGSWLAFGGKGQLLPVVNDETRSDQHRGRMSNRPNIVYLREAKTRLYLYPYQEGREEPRVLLGGKSCCGQPSPYSGTSLVKIRYSEIIGKDDLGFIKSKFPPEEVRKN